MHPLLVQSVIFTLTPLAARKQEYSVHTTDGECAQLLRPTIAAAIQIRTGGGERVLSVLHYVVT